MTLQNWLEYGWLRAHKSSKKGISDLFQIIDRDLHDAAGDISADWRFGIAYNAALKLCTILLHAEGYRPEKNLQHFRTIQSLPLILGKKHEQNAKYLDTCRNIRNVAEYDYVGGITKDDVAELVGYVNELRDEVLRWLNENHPELL
ncbi:MAG: hypothetical protein Q8K00_19960 [Syntrophales bacterium]|nr:hypothetical protein [Syntrophales bacterium]